MDKVIIDINTQKVVSYNSNVKPFQFTIDVLNINSISKMLFREVKKQRTNIFGEKLYKINVNGILQEVTKENINDYDASPIIDTFNKVETVSLVNNLYDFNLEDIVDNKKSQLKEQFSYNNCLLYEINLQEQVDLNYNLHKADTGYKIIRIPANGSVLFKPIILGADTKNVKLCFESSENINIQYSFNGIDYFLSQDNTISKTLSFNKFYFKIINNSINSNDITSFAILY